MFILAMYIVLDKIEWFPKLYPKSQAFVVHYSETLCNFYDYIIRHHLLSTFPVWFVFGEP